MNTSSYLHNKQMLVRSLAVWLVADNLMLRDFWPYGMYV
jgi:hypothetical protein